MQRDNFYSKISKRSFSKIYKNYSKGKISRVLPANIILSPFPYGFHPCNGEMQERVTCAFHSRTRPKGIKRERKGEKGRRERRERKRERKREREGRERRERERERKGEGIVVGRSQRRLLASRRLDSKEQSFARSNERSLIRV